MGFVPREESGARVGGPRGASGRLVQSGLLLGLVARFFEAAVE